MPNSSSELTFRAAVLVKQREPLEIKKIRCSEALSIGEVLVKPSYAGICGTQLGEIDGKKGLDPHLPHLLGHEACAQVLAIGPGVTRTKPGDKVVLHWMKAPGIQAQPPTYFDDSGLTINAGFVTTFNEYAKVSENRLTPIPASVPDPIAALLGCAVTTGLGMVQHDLDLKLGASLLVLGVGGVGLSVVAGGALLSASPLIALDQNQDRLALARQMGADICINAEDFEGNTQEKNAQIKSQVLAIAGSQGIDCVVECSGNPGLIELAYELTHPAGTCLLSGVAPHHKPTAFNTLDLLLGKKLKGSFGGGARPDIDILRYLKLMDAHKLQIEPMLGERTMLSEINDSIDRMRQGKTTGRTLIRFET